MVLFGGLTESLFFFFPFCGIAAHLSSEGQCILSLCVGGFLKTNSFRVATCARFFLHKGQQYHVYTRLSYFVPLTAFIQNPLLFTVTSYDIVAIRKTIHDFHSSCYYNSLIRFVSCALWRF